MPFTDQVPRCRGQYSENILTTECINSSWPVIRCLQYSVIIEFRRDPEDVMVDWSSLLLENRPAWSICIC